MKRRGRDRYAGLTWRLGGERTDEEIRAEFEHHLAERTQDYMEAGMSRENAEAEARRRLGDVERYLAETRSIDATRHGQRRRRRLFDDGVREIRQSARSLARSPLFAFVAVLTLALGLGATATIWTLVDSVVLRPLPYADAGELVFVASRVTGGGAAGQWGVSPGGYFHYRDNNRVFASLGAYVTQPANVSGDGEAERIVVAGVTAGVMEVFGVRPAAGRTIRPDDDLPSAGRVVMLSHSFWRRRYGGDPGIVGRSILLDTSPVEVVGVLPAGFALPLEGADVLEPLRLNPAGPFFNSHYLRVVARLRPGETMATAERDLARLTAQFTEVLPQAYSESFVRDYGFSVEALPLRAQVLGGSERTLWVLLAAVALVLVIACANVANLFLVRAEVRRRETAVRSALGAERGHLAWHAMAESLLITMTAAAAAAALTWSAMGTLRRIAPGGIPRLDEASPGASTLLLLFLLALVLGVIFGTFPLLRSARDSSSVLREGGRGSSASRRQHLVRGTLVAAQIALALMLLASAGLMLRSFTRLRNVDPGVEAAGVLTASLALPFERYRDFERTNQFHRELIERLEALPGVERAAVATVLPLASGGFCSLVFVEDQPVEPGVQPPCLTVALASPGWFEALGITVQGGTPSWTDNDTRSGAVVVSRALAQRFWPGQNAVGRGIRSNGNEPPYYRVVGVTDDVRFAGLDQPATEVVYYPLLPIPGAQLWSPPRQVSLVVRGRTDQPLSLVPAVRATLAELDADVPLANISSMESIVRSSTARTSFAMILLAVAATMALILSAVGLYGLISYIVGQRRGEIGVRMALGARASGIAGMVIKQAVRLAAIGVVIGLLLALATTRLLASLLFEVSPVDPLTLVGVGLGLVVVAIVASWVPARRAAGVSPVEVMRVE